MSENVVMQKTISNPIEYSGIALHTGEMVHIRCLPAEIDNGITFRRIDLDGTVDIKAEPGNVVSTRRCTSLGITNNDEIAVHTVEHLMSALWASDIDNLIIEIDNAETPVCDGSALPYIDLINEAGVKELPAIRRVKRIDEPIWARKDDMYIVVLPYDGFKISYTLVYDHPVVGTQFFEFDMKKDNFLKEIAPARTFGFEREVEMLHRRGLALGGSLENAVLIGEEGTVNPVRYQNEFVRHKILDVIGDMFLNGYISGHIMAVRSGHYLHVELARNINKVLNFRR